MAPCRQRLLSPIPVVRAGMLKQRVITALWLVALLSGVLFALPPAGVWVAFSFVAGLAAWEWGGLMRQASRVRIAFGVVCGGIFAAIAFAQVSESAIGQCVLAGASGFWLLVVPLWLKFRWSLARVALLGHFLGMLLILSTCIAVIVLQQRSPWLLLAAMALVWVADVAAYFAGRQFGRRKLAPTISPAKTWEGVAGAVLGVLVYAVVLFSITPLASSWHRGYVELAVLLAILTGLSVIGDLFESMLKRQADIKDSSQLLPGHGGILDRIDALTSTLPVIALIVVIASQ